MDPLNTVFFQGSNEEQINEFAYLIDQILEKLEEVKEKKFSNSVQALLEQDKLEDVHSLLISHVSTLLKLEDHNIVAGFNFYIAQLKTLDAEKSSVFTKAIVHGLVSSESENGYGKLALLETLYNSIDQSSSIRLSVLAGIVAVASKHDLTKTIVNLLATVTLAISKSKSEASASRALLFSLSDALKKGSYKKQSYESLLNYLYTFNNKEEVTEEVLTSAKRAILEAASIREVLNFESLFQSVPVQCLSGQPIYEFAELFLTQDVSKYSVFISKNAALVEDPSFDKETSFHKIRLLTVASLGAQNLGVSISYSAIAEALKLDSEDVEGQVELFVIDVIRAGLIEAKLNQLDGNIVVTRSTHRSFDKSQWKTLLAEFSSWRDSLELVAQTVENSIATINSSHPTTTLPVPIAE